MHILKLSLNYFVICKLLMNSFELLKVHCYIVIAAMHAFIES